MEGIMFKLGLEKWIEIFKSNNGNEDISIKKKWNQILVMQF